MSFDYANTDPNRRRVRFGSRLIPLVIGLAVVAIGAFAARKYTALNRGAVPSQPAASHPAASVSPAATKP